MCVFVPPDAHLWLVPCACSYGLAIGARLAWFVWLLMTLTAPVSWPIAKLLDWVLGSGHHVLFRRAELKALVDIHSVGMNV